MVTGAEADAPTDETGASITPMNENRLASGRFGPSQPLLMLQHLPVGDRCIGHAPLSPWCMGQSAPDSRSGARASAASWQGGVVSA